MAQAYVPKSEWELEQERLNWKEGELKLPAYPGAKGLIEFFVSGTTSFKFFIDPASLSVGADGVVRYTLVARSPSGVANISYEGVHCRTKAYRVFALGHDGRWVTQDSRWRDTESKSIQRWHVELRTRYFCPDGLSIATAAEGVDALRRGGHPGIAQFSRGS